MVEPSNKSDILFDKAIRALNKGNLDQASRAASRLTKREPRSTDAWQLRSLIAQNQGAHNDAAKYLKRLLKLNPYDAGAWNNLGNAHRERGQFSQAKDAYLRSLRLRAEDIPTLMNVGDIYRELREFDEAAKIYDRILELSPDLYEALLNFATVRVRMREFDAALKIYQRLLDLGYENTDTLSGLYQCLVLTGQIQDGYGTLRRLLELSDYDPEFLVAGSILLLLMGRWQEGWEAYAQRWRWKPNEARPYTLPWWRGENIHDGTLLVWGEQGLGDEIMFASMVPDLVDKGLNVVLECDARLVGLFSQSFPQVTCVASKSVPDPVAVEADFQVPSPALGQWFRCDESDFHSGRPFLRVDDMAVNEIKRRYIEQFGGGALIGISWRSENPEIGPDKSIPLDDLYPILSVSGATFVNLQYGDTAAERQCFADDHDVILHHDISIDPVVDVLRHAEQIAAMDLIISISTSAVHLAGALGIPTWVIVQKTPDRRWLMDRDDCPWYSSVRLFRQSRQGSWDEPIANATHALETFLHRYR